MVEETRRRLDRLRGRPATAVDPAFEVPADMDAPGCVGITLDELVKRFYAEKSGRVNDRKRVEYERLFALLREVWGPDRRVRTVDREACRQVRGVVAALPPNAGKR